MAKQKIRPLEDRVVIKQIEAEEKTAGGIVLPDTAKEKPQRGIVLAVGPGQAARLGRACSDRRGRRRRSALRQVLGNGNQGRRRGDQDPPRVRHPGEDCQVIPPTAGAHPTWDGVPRPAALFIPDSRSTRPWPSNCSSPTPPAGRFWKASTSSPTRWAPRWGPTGRNVILSKSFGGPTVTKDGVTVSKEIELRRPVREHGGEARQRGRLEDVRRGRRRHDDGDHPGPRDLSRGAQEHHLGRQSRRPSAAGSKRPSRPPSPSWPRCRGRSPRRKRSPRSARSRPTTTPRSARCWPTRSSGSAATA